ncbi:MAG: glycine dehydrogenase subunit 2 [Nitrososphaeraceae archaeon]
MKIIFEYQDEQVSGHIKPCDNESNNINDVIDDNNLLRKDLPLPDVSEATVVRHYTNLSRLNYGIDVGFYPLGSCTMKYNPKINEDISSLEGFKDLHPYSSVNFIQGSLKIMWHLEQYLKALTGMDSFSLQPSAGAQAELLGLMIAKSYFADRLEPRRSKVIIPDSAHGSNPASASMMRYQTLSIPTDTRGNIDFTKFKAALDETVAVVMLTNPNTLGLYEEDILQISDLAHTNGSLMYCDGANMNALLGITRQADHGFDLIHLNLHKTFSAPHGGGGPGAGALGVRSHLSDYLPVPRIVRKCGSSKDDYVAYSNQTRQTSNIDIGRPNGDGIGNLRSTTLVEHEQQEEQEEQEEQRRQEQQGPDIQAIGSEDEEKMEDVDEWKDYFALDYTKRRSVGRIKCFYGNFGTIVRAYSYIRSWGSNISKVSEGAILNANYLMSLLKDTYELPFSRPCAHEFVVSSRKFGSRSALGIAKRLMDYGFHPPTMYFPLIVPEALMIEPTETESKQTLDEFADALTKIAYELQTQADLVREAPHTKQIRRLDEVYAARNPSLRWKPR